ncbi:hypothetical protein R1flu_006683 [Riccia fluitans]|uniref:Uncharacterized protein n=1 Tax=Riccia fluitans TaxID=41844 RepID=A0ABD1YXT2_9MARC
MKRREIKKTNKAPIILSQWQSLFTNGSTPGRSKRVTRSAHGGPELNCGQEAALKDRAQRMRNESSRVMKRRFAGRSELPHPRRNHCRNKRGELKHGQWRAHCTVRTRPVLVDGKPEDRG